MAVPTGTASMLDIQNEFGGSNPISLSEYYGVVSGVPTSGAISINDFRGKSGQTTISDSFVLTYNYSEYKGTVSESVYLATKPLSGAWTPPAGDLVFPKASPFSYGGQSGPIFMGMAVNGPSGTITGSYAFLPNTTLNSFMFYLYDSATGGFGNLSLSNSISSGGVYQNGSLLWSITGTSIVTYNGTTAVRIIFNGNIMTDMFNRGKAGNTTGYEMRLTF